MSERANDGVDARLREMAELSRRWLDSPEGGESTRLRVREARQTAVTDLSPEAIDARIRTVAGLRRLCLELGRARPASGQR